MSAPFILVESNVVYKKIIFIAANMIFVLTAVYQLNAIWAGQSVYKVVAFLKDLNESVSDVNQDVRVLLDILQLSEEPPNDGKSIFFIESYEREDKVPTLTPRQACSVEAAGKCKFDILQFLTFCFQQEQTLISKSSSCFHTRLDILIRHRYR